MSGEQDKLSVSLEPPKLFGRKKKARKSEPDPAPEPTDAPAAPAEPADDTTPTEAPEPPAASPDEPADESAPADVPDTPAAEVPATEAAQDATVSEDTEVIATGRAEPARSEDVPVERDHTSVLPATDEAIDAPLMDKIETGLADDELTPPASASPAGPSLVDRLRDRFGRKERRGPDLSHEGADDEESAADAAAYPAPMLDHYPAAVLTGAIVGLGMVTLTWLSLRGCEAIRGTASCGGGPGFLLLVAMFVVSVMLGSAILKSFEVPDPGSSSFLAVGLVAVVALLLLIDVLDHWSMLLVVPVVSIGAYLLSVYITKTFVEPNN